LTRINKILKEIYGDKIPDPKNTDSTIANNNQTDKNTESINKK